jgi:hypothetical protein
VHHAAKTSNPDVFRLLLTTGADVNARDKKDNTPLLAVVSWLHYGTFTLPFDDNTRITTFCLLLDAGADINAANIEGETALHALAAQYGKPSVSHEQKSRILEATKLLLAMGVKTEVVDRHGKRAVDLGTQDNPFTQMVNSTRKMDN